MWLEGAAFELSLLLLSFLLLNFEFFLLQFLKALLIELVVNAVGCGNSTQGQLLGFAVDLRSERGLLLDLSFFGKEDALRRRVRLVEKESKCFFELVEVKNCL